MLRVSVFGPLNKPPSASGHCRELSVERPHCFCEAGIGVGEDLMKRLISPHFEREDKGEGDIFLACTEGTFLACKEGTFLACTR